MRESIQDTDNIRRQADREEKTNGIRKKHGWRGNVKVLR